MKKGHRIYRCSASSGFENNPHFFGTAVDKLADIVFFRTHDIFRCHIRLSLCVLVLSNNVTTER